MIYTDDERKKKLGIVLRKIYQWMLDNENGGCATCDHFAGTTRERKITAEEYEKQFYNMCNADSFFNDNEFSLETRKCIYDILRN